MTDEPEQNDGRERAPAVPRDNHPVVPMFGIQVREHVPYGFEASNRDSPGGSRRASTEAARDLQQLAENLGIPPGAVDRIGAGPLLCDFILHHHLNIEWYQARMAREQKRQRGFFWGSVALLVLIPVLTFGISYVNQGSSPALVAAQLTAVLAGIIGFQSALRSLFEKRNVITLFHKASSALKQAVYDFEDRWAGCVPVDAGSVAEIEIFKANLRQMIRKARDVEAEERDAYFASQAGYPLLDLRALLSDAGSAAAEIVGRHAWKRAERPELAAAGMDAVQNIGLRVDALQAKLAVLRAHASRATDEEQRRIISQEIAATEALLDEAEQALLAAAVRRFDRLP